MEVFGDLSCAAEAIAGQRVRLERTDVAVHDAHRHRAAAERLVGRVVEHAGEHDQGIDFSLADNGGHAVGLAAVAKDEVDSRFAESFREPLHDAGVEDVAEQLRERGGVDHPDSVGALEPEAAAGGIRHEIELRALVDDLLPLGVAHAAPAVDRVRDRGHRTTEQLCDINQLFASIGTGHARILRFPPGLARLE